MTNEEKNQMFLRNENLIYYVMKKLNILSMEDEFYDIALIGITKGINTYDKNKNIKESTYLYKCIYYEMIKYIKLNLNRDLFRKKCLSLNDTFGTDVELGECITDNKINFESEIEQKDYENYIYNLILKLIPSQQKAICKYYGIKEKQKNIPQISKEEGVSKQCIQQRIKAGLKRLKKIMEVKYEN